MLHNLDDDTLPVESTSDDFSGSLYSYLRNVGTIEMLSSDEQQVIGADAYNVIQELKDCILPLGFVLPELARVVDECTQSRRSPEDFILFSQLDDNLSKNPAQVKEMLQAWKSDILAAYNELNEAYFAGKPTDKIQTKIQELTNKFYFNISVVEELYFTLLEYLKLLSNDNTLGKIVLTDEAKESSYLKMLEKKMLSSGEKIVEIFNRARAIHNRYIVKRDRMIESNLRLVISVAHRYRNRGIPFNDLIQEGNLGLLKAIQRFDFLKGIKFGTYAIWWIKHHILRCVAEQSRVIRIPAHMMNAINQLNWLEQNHIQKFGCAPDIEELALKMDMSVAKVNALRRMALQPISLQAQINSQDDINLEELIADDSTSTPTLGISKRFLYAKLYEMLGTLSEREQQIIILRFGLYGKQELPLADVSKIFNLTRERVRQIEKKIMDKLRSPERLKYIDGANGVEPE
jgi:RNA polymerase primary sigma factor